MKDRRFGVIDIAALLILAFVCVAILGFTSPTPAPAQNPFFECQMCPPPSPKIEMPEIKNDVDWRDYVPDYGQYDPPPVQFKPLPVVPRGLPQSDYLYPTLELQLQADAIASQGVSMDMQNQILQNQVRQNEVIIQNQIRQNQMLQNQIRQNQYYGGQ